MVIADKKQTINGITMGPLRLELKAVSNTCSFQSDYVGFCCQFQCHFISSLGEGGMPSLECPTNSSTEFETDAISAHPVQATAARHSVS